MKRDDLDRNEREALLVTCRHDRELLKTVTTGLVLVTTGCAYWIFAAAAICFLSGPRMRHYLTLSEQQRSLAAAVVTQKCKEKNGHARHSRA